MYLYIQPESNYYSTLSNDFTLKYNETPYVRLAKAIYCRKMSSRINLLPTNTWYSRIRCRNWLCKYNEKKRRFIAFFMGFSYNQFVFWHKSIVLYHLECFWGIIVRKERNGRIKFGVPKKNVIFALKWISHLILYTSTETNKP